MNRTRRQRADALFDESLELHPERRDAFLDERCCGQPDIRAEVAELLRLVEAPAPALEEACGLHLLPELVELGPADTWPRTGDVIGAWRIVRPIGRGGMGAVFLVQRSDGQFAQTGALKLVRAGLDTDSITRRFERERQIVASLTHPGIARLLDGGRTRDGRPYFVMEHVAGRPIDKDCDERRLSIAERLELFERVCRAVQHAHSQLVVHRDVKPSNIVVTPDGDVKLLDFGIAGILEPSGAVPGEPVDGPSGILTPDYASPEQVRGGPIATSSDVYQLGLLLYELLTGQRGQHVEGRSHEALDRAVCGTPAPPPSQRIAAADDATCRARRATRRALVGRLRGDLDAIVGRALQKEPHRRYASVADLVEDIRRHTRGLPVRARADSLTYRAGRFMARHRVALASAAAVLVTIAVAAPIVTRERMRAADERQRARQVEEVLGHLFSLPNARRMSRAPSAEVLVEHAARLVRRDLQSQAASQARLLTMLGGVYSSMGRYEAAIDVFQEAHALRAHEFGPDSAEAAESLVAQAQSQHFSGRYEEAERNLRRAAAMLHDRLGPTHRQTLSAALEMGDLLHTRGDLVHAERTLQAAIERLRSFAAPPEMMSRAVRDLGNVQRDRGDLVRSDALFRESLRVLDRADFDASAQTAITEVYFSRLLVKRRAFSEADDLLARALPALRLSYEGDHPMMAFALQNLGYLRMEEGRFGEADGHLADARRVAIAWLGADHPLVARITADQAELARRQGRIPDAIEIARHALAQFERFGLARHPAAIDAHWTLGDALIAARLPSEAGRILRAGVAAAERQYVAGDARIARARQLLARASLPRQ